MGAENLTLGMFQVLCFGCRARRDLVGVEILLFEFFKPFVAEVVPIGAFLEL